MNLWRMKKILKGSDIMKNGKKWSGGVLLSKCNASFFFKCGELFK